MRGVWGGEGGEKAACLIDFIMLLSFVGVLGFMYHTVQCLIVHSPLPPPLFLTMTQS